MLARKLIAPTAGGGGGNYDALDALFDASEVGGLWLPGFSSMWQNTARTTPAIAVDDPVRVIDDLSGNDNHLVAPSDAARPLIKQTGGGLWYLQFDGTNDCMVVSIDFSGVDEVTVFSGAEKQDNTARIVYELTDAISSNAGAFNLLAGVGSSQNGWHLKSRGDATDVAAQTARAYPFSGVDNAVVVGLHDISGDTSTGRRNQSAFTTSSTADKGAGNFANANFNVGSRGAASLFFNGKLFALCARGALTSGTTLTDAEDNTNELTGAY